MTNRSETKEGFTIIELLVVVAIIAILASISIPIFMSNMKKSYNSVALSDLRNFESLIESYYSDNQMYPDL